MKEVGGRVQEARAGGKAKPNQEKTPARSVKEACDLEKSVTLSQEIGVSSREVLFEGLSEQEILHLPQEEIENMILLGEPLVFRAGSAVLLGSFKIARGRLVIEIAQIEGGGEGVLVSLASPAKRYAKLHTLSGVEWIVHAVSCAEPNLKLRRVLERRGFIIKEIEGIGEAYYLLESTAY